LSRKRRLRDRSSHFLMMSSLIRASSGKDLAARLRACVAL
jgi:hypothetical protein